MMKKLTRKRDSPSPRIIPRRHEIHWDAPDVTERYRILAHIIEARSRATGATEGIQGEFHGPEADLSDPIYAFGHIHSAEFLGDAITARKYYQKLMNTFDLNRYEKN